jgi:hypothetical protein
MHASSTPFGGPDTFRFIYKFIPFSKRYIMSWVLCYTNSTKVVRLLHVRASAD